MNRANNFKWLPIILFFWSVFFVAAVVSADDFDNAIDLSVNPEGDYAENVYMYNNGTTNNTVSFEWEEKAFYGKTDEDDTTIHPKITVTNQGKKTGDLYIKLDILDPAGASTYYLYYKDSDGMKVLDLNSTKTKCVESFEPDESLTIFDVIADEDWFEIGFPMIFSGFLTKVNDDSTIYGFDTETVFFNTPLEGSGYLDQQLD